MHRYNRNLGKANARKSLIDYHCEVRSAVAIHAAHGLPRFVRNDDGFNQGFTRMGTAAKLVLLSLVGALSACASYRDPDVTVPRARLRVIGVKDLAVSGESGRACGARGKANIIQYSESRSDRSSGRSLGMPNPERIGNRPFAEVYVEADKSFSMTWNYHHWLGGGFGGYYKECNIDGAFTPSEHADYELEFKVYGSVCVLSFFKLTDSKEWESVPIKRDIPEHPQDFGTCPKTWQGHILKL